MEQAELLKSHNWRDHDWFCYGPTHPITIMERGQEPIPAERCSCGGWFYTPSVDEVHDL